MAPSLLKESQRLRLESQPLDPSNMNRDLVASGKLCSVLTSGAVLHFARTRLLEWPLVLLAFALAPGEVLVRKRSGRLMMIDRLREVFLCKQPSSAFVFLLLYLTGRVVLDNRHGLPKQFDGFMAAQTCRPLRHNFKC